MYPTKTSYTPSITLCFTGTLVRALRAKPLLVTPSQAGEHWLCQVKRVQLMIRCLKGMLVAITQDWDMSFMHSLLVAPFCTLLLLLLCLQQAPGLQHEVR